LVSTDDDMEFSTPLAVRGTLPLFEISLWPWWPSPIET
jgi:hypothetical protein